MRRREELPERRPAGPRREPAPDPRLLLVQQTGGNAALQRLLARQPAKTEADPVPADLKAWHERKLTTNPEYAQWILDAETQGFVRFPKRTRDQLEDLKDSKKVVRADPASTDVIGGLEISHALIDERATRWIGDPTKAKDPFVINDYIRNEKGGHGSGERLDVGGFDWTGSKGPDQVVNALKTLPAGKYGIGLPFQGEFFPLPDWFGPQAEKAVADAQAASKTTAEITTPLLVKGNTQRITGAWSADSKTAANWDVPAGWTTKTVGPSAVSSLKSATLKKEIKDLNAAGYDIYVFPDNNSHIHIQKGNG